MNFEKKIISTLCLLAICFSACGSSRTLSSKWRDRDITVDGLHDEWAGGMTFIEKENVSIGFFNDSDYLYISLISQDRDIHRQFMGMGFHLWIDASGGESRAFGIKFPTGIMSNGYFPGNRGESRDMDGMRERFDESLDMIEIVTSKNGEPQSMSIQDLKGIEIKIGDPAYGLIYEIKLPLNKHSGSPFAIGAAPGETVGVGFETGKFDRSQMRQRMGNGGFGGRGGRGGSGGGRGGRGGGFGGGRRQMPDQFKLWTKIKLVSESKAINLSSKEE